MFIPRLLALLLLLGSGAQIASAQSSSTLRPKTFASIPWGASIADVFRILSQRSGITAPEDLPLEDKIEILGGNFAGQPVLKWTFEFVERKMVSAAVLIKPESNPIGLFRDFKQEIVAKHGPATGERRLGEAKDRVEGHQLYGTSVYWKFPAILGDKEQKSIVCELSTAEGGASIDLNTMMLTLRYTNDTLRSAKPTGGNRLPEPAAVPGPKPLRKEDF